MLKKNIQQSLKQYLNKGLDMKYLNLVELVKEKPAYTKAGVQVGDFGAIMSKKPVNGKWQVIFSEFYIGKDDGLFCYLADLRLLHSLHNN